MLALIYQHHGAYGYEFHFYGVLLFHVPTGEIPIEKLLPHMDPMQALKLLSDLLLARKFMKCRWPRCFTNALDMDMEWGFSLGDWVRTCWKPRRIPMIV